MAKADSAPQDQSQPQREVLLAGIGKPLRDFLRTESGSAGLLLAAAVLALLWANSPWSDSYFNLWSTEIGVRVGRWSLNMDLYHWINDGVMVIFFFVIGLELRHEMSVGEMRKRRRLILPAICGIGGLVVPALLYLLVNPSGDAAHGWGVVIGTDTAFLLGALALVGPKASTQLRVFLLTMTIVDDFIAVAIIGIVYSEAINLGAVAIAGGFLVVIALMGRWGTWQNLAYVFAGVGAWLATIHSGLHPSIVGMLAGVLVVSHAPRRDALERASELFHAFRQSPLPSAGLSARRGLQRAVAPNERFQEILHPWTSYVIVPIFALANAGVDLRGGELANALSSPITWGVVLGLVVGKPIGITLATWLGVRLGAGPLPRGVGWGDVIGGGALSGLGFSVSLLIAGLAFDSPEMKSAATIGVILACALSFVSGWVAFRASERVFGERPMPLSMVLDPPVDPARDHIRGRADAPLTVVEFGDFQCPFCSASTNVVRELRLRFGDDLRYVFRHLPLADVHPEAELAAQAVEAAGAQGKFWEMYELLFERQDELQYEDLLGYAGELRLDVEEFARAIGDGRYDERVQEDVASAEVSGARRTPTFFIGGRRHVGPWDTASLVRELEALQENPRLESERQQPHPAPGVA